MIKFKRFAGILLGTALAAAALSACGQSTASEETKASAASTPAGSTEAASENADTKAAAAGSSASADTDNAASDDSLKKLQESGSLRVGVEGTYPPYTYHDDSGKLVGFDVELAEAIAKKLGVKAEFTEAAWDSLLAGIDSGRLDTVINAVSITDEREEKYDFAGPYFSIVQQVIVASDNDSIKSEADLPGKREATNITNAYAEEKEKKGITIVPINTVDDAAQVVETGRADYCTLTSVIFNEYIKNHPDAKLKVAFELTDEVENFGIPVKKGDTALRDAIQTALTELEADGTLSKLSEQYFGFDYYAAKN